MRRIEFACSAFILLSLFVGGASRSAASDQERLQVRNGKKLICSVWFLTSMHGDCGTESYDEVFIAKILAVRQVPVRTGQNVAKAFGATYASDLSLTVEPEEVFKGHPPHEAQIFAEQGECFPVLRVGDNWLFFGNSNAKTNGLEISYNASNPSGPVEQRREYIERLRRLERGDGLSYVIGELDFPTVDFSNGGLSDPRSNHRLLIKAEDGKRSYSVTTNADGKFELGPVAPGSFQIDANTDSQFRDVWERALSGTDSQANGCSFVRIELEINSEISGRVILPEGYRYKKSEIGNYFPLFDVEISTLDGKQALGRFGPSIGDGLKFVATGLAPGSYLVQLVNYSGETWLKEPVYAPGVTDKSTALRVDLGFAEHRTGLEIRVPLEALKAAK